MPGRIFIQPVPLGIHTANLASCNPGGTDIAPGKTGRKRLPLPVRLSVPHTGKPESIPGFGCLDCLMDCPETGKAKNQTEFDS